MEALIKLGVDYMQILFKSSLLSSWLGTEFIKNLNLSPGFLWASAALKASMKGTVKEFDENQFKRNEVLFSGSEELNKLLDNPDNDTLKCVKNHTNLLRFCYKRYFSLCKNRIEGKMQRQPLIP